MKTNKLKIGVMLLTASLTVGTISCKKKGCTDVAANNYSAEAKKDDGSCTYTPDETTTAIITKAGMISSNETWTANNIYKIVGKVVVEDGVTLTIEPGTIVKGETGAGTLASALVVAKGGTLVAVGTALKPIIFTSILDNIKVGELTGTNLSEVDQGLWGGIIVLGNAPISAADGDDVSQIEGIPVTDLFGAFGGTDATDNSGTLSYISIRHGGALIGAGNEINGLTLGGVGSGTTISNIEVVSNLDDGIEFFGGTVDVSNVLVGYQGDDGVDIDMNYAGTVSNFLVINGTNSDKGLEVDGPEGVTNLNGMFTLMNGTVIDYLGANAIVDFKSKAQGTVQNVSMGEVKIRASYQNDCNDAKTDALTHLINTTPTLAFTSSEFGAVSVYTKSNDDAGTTACTVHTQDQTDANAAMVQGTATGADASGFASWTWAGVNNKL